MAMSYTDYLYLCEKVFSFLRFQFVTAQYQADKEGREKDTAYKQNGQVNEWNIPY